MPSGHEALAPSNVNSPGGQVVGGVPLAKALHVEGGASEQDIETMLVTNPRAYFER